MGLVCWCCPWAGNQKCVTLQRDFSVNLCSWWLCDTLNICLTRSWVKASAAWSAASTSAWLIFRLEHGSHRESVLFTILARDFCCIFILVTIFIATRDVKPGCTLATPASSVKSMNLSSVDISRQQRWKGVFCLWLFFNYLYVLVTFCCCDQTPWPKATYWKVYFGLQFPGIKVHHRGESW